MRNNSIPGSTRASRVGCGASPRRPFLFFRFWREFPRKTGVPPVSKVRSGETPDFLQLARHETEDFSSSQLKSSRWRGRNAPPSRDPRAARRVRSPLPETLINNAS